MSFSSEDLLDNIPTGQRFDGEFRSVNETASSENAGNSNQARPPSVPAEFSSRASSPESASTESSISSAANSSSPPTSPTPFVHWKILDREIDINWDKYEDELSEKEKDQLRKKQGKLACVGLRSVATEAEVNWAMKYYDKEGMWAIPHRRNRPHVFNKIKQNFGLPRMVLTPTLISLGVGAPMHPYLMNFLEWYDLAPIQLSPHSYKLILVLLILYNDLELSDPTIPEVSHFFGLSQSSICYYYLSPTKAYNKMGFSEGKISHERR